MSDSLRPHESQDTRPPCPSPTPRVYSNSCPSSRWCHPAISSSVVPFPSCPQSLPASGSFPMSQLFTWGGQRIGVSSSAPVLPMNTQGWSPLGWTGWIFLQSNHFMANRCLNNGNSDRLFLVSKITADGDCSHEIKRLLLLWRKAVTDLDNKLKSREITLSTKVHLTTPMVFSVVMYWIIKKDKHQRSDAFELWGALGR